MSSNNTTKKRKVDSDESGISLAAVLAEMQEMKSKLSHMDELESRCISLQNEMDGMRDRLSRMDDMQTTIDNQQSQIDKLESKCMHLEDKCNSYERSIELLTKEKRWRNSAPGIPQSPPIQIQSNGLIQNHTLDVRGEMATSGYDHRSNQDWYNQECKKVQEALENQYTICSKALSQISLSLEDARRLMEINIDSHLLIRTRTINSNKFSSDPKTPTLRESMFTTYVLQDSVYLIDVDQCQPKNVGFCCSLLLSLCEHWQRHIPTSAGRYIGIVNVDGKKIISYALGFIGVFSKACRKLECDKSQYKEHNADIKALVLMQVEKEFAVAGGVNRWLLEDLIRRLWIISGCSEDIQL